MVWPPRLESAVAHTARLIAKAGGVIVGWAWPWGVVIAAILGLGITAAALRMWIIDVSPWVVHHSKLVAGVYNVWGYYLDITLFEAKAMITVIKDIIIGAEHFFGDHKKSYVPFSKRIKFTKISPHEVANIFNALPIECNNYVSAWEIAKGSLINAHGHDVCRVRRAFYTTPVDPLLSAVLGWLSDGADYPPGPYGFGCQDTPQEMLWFCVPFGSGVIILELVVPFLVLGVIAAALWVARAKLAFGEKVQNTNSMAKDNKATLDALTSGQ